MNKLSLLVFIQFIQTAMMSKYEMRCPVAGEWRFRGSKFNCSYNQYVCLFRSPGDIYHESCDGVEFSSTGSKLIFEPFLNKADCSYKRYQPFTFSTDGSSNCVYQKSICNEKGQYVVDQNSLKSDTTCGCYISKGYELVSKPKHNRYCIPSEEDCSCHKVPCNNRDKPCPQDDDEMKTRPSLEDNLFKKLSDNGLINTWYTFNDDNNGIKYRRYGLYVTAALLIFMITVTIVYVSYRKFKMQHKQMKKKGKEFDVLKMENKTNQHKIELATYNQQDLLDNISKPDNQQDLLDNISQPDSEERSNSKSSAVPS